MALANSPFQMRVDQEGMMGLQQQLGVASPLGGLDHFAQILEP
jgi:hypothetical protein